MVAPALDLLEDLEAGAMEPATYSYLAQHFWQAHVRALLPAA